MDPKEIKKKAKKKPLLTLTRSTTKLEVDAETTVVEFPLENGGMYRLELIAGQMQDDTFILLECGDEITKKVAVALAKKILELAKD